MFDVRAGLRQIPWRLCAIGSLIGLVVFLLIAGPLIAFHNHPDSFFAFFHSIRPALRSLLHSSKPKKEAIASEKPPDSQEPTARILAMLSRPSDRPPDCVASLAKVPGGTSIMLQTDDGNLRHEPIVGASTDDTWKADPKWKHVLVGDHHTSERFTVIETKDRYVRITMTVLEAPKTSAGLAAFRNPANNHYIGPCQAYLEEHLPRETQALFYGTYGIGETPPALASTGATKNIGTPSAP